VPTEESEPYSLGMNLFTPAAMAASITTACSPRATIGMQLMTASCPLNALVRDSRLKSLAMTLAPVGNLAVELVRVRSVIFRFDCSSMGRMAFPTFPLACDAC